MSIRGFCRFVAGSFVKIFYRHKTYGIEHLGKKGAVIAPNHASYLDPPLIGVSCPIPVHFLAKSTLFKKPYFAWFFKKLNTHPLERGRGNASTIKLASRLIKNGEKLVLFPEGRRSKSGELQKGENGIGFLVLLTQCEVIPVYIHGADKIWNTHQSYPKLSGKTACVFGSPLYFDDYFEKDKKEAMQLISDRVLEAIAELKEWYLAGAKGHPP